MPEIEKEGLINEGIKYLQREHCKKIGAVGYCTGATWVLNFLHPIFGVETVHAGFIAHPAGVTTKMLEEVTFPLSIASADEDEVQLQKDRRETEDILLKNGFPYQMNLYSHVHHGFAVRRAVTTKAEIYAKKQAFIQAVTWFEEHLINGA
jgi:dienelactone hydrolase